MPVYHDGRHLMVGVEQNTQAVSTLPTVQQTNGFRVRRGQLNDGAGQQIIARYFDYTVDMSDLRYSSAPVVRFGGDGDANDFERVIRAVQLVNTALPDTHKMRVASNSASSDPNTGIYFNFVNNFGGTHWGVTYNSNSSNSNQITHSQIDINKAYTDNGDRQATILLAHELLHALGFFGGSGHVPVDLDSILEATSNVYLTRQDQAQPLSILYPADREALRALYVFRRGASVDDFGPWSSTSLHLAATGEYVAFGSAWRNGYAEPWAYGIQPRNSLANNASLSGSATWEGLLLGWSRGRAVSGDAEINVNLASMDGDAEFTELAHMDTAAQWGDGDLVYAIRVNGNTFRQTGGDAGTLTGIFTGASHEGTAGTLERSDLTAAFGAAR